MDIFLTVLAFLFIVVGFAGCILPVLPGPPISFVGLLLFHFTSYVQYSTLLLVILGVATVLITVADQILPVWMTKRVGGSKYGIWGSTIGVLLGCFLFPPVGIIVCPFLGALVGELLNGGQSQKAFKAALGSFLGFLVGIGVKLILTGVIAFYYFRSLWNFIVN